MYYQGQGLTHTVKYSDLIDRKVNKEPEKTGDEIALDVIQKAGLRFK